MKTKLAVIIILFLCIILNSLAQTVWLYTPKGKQVYAFRRAEMSSTDIQYTTNLVRNAYPQATVLGNASLTYNCHSYAWNLTEGGTAICWLNQWLDPYTETGKNLHYYWEDGRYEVTTEANAEKIFYYNGDHSAVKSSVAGMYESKWGEGPLMRHAPTDGPSIYNMQYRRYYKKSPPPTISGPSYVCPGNIATFTAHNAPASYSWGYGNLTPVAGSPGSFRTSSTPGNAWVSIGTGTVELARRDLTTRLIPLSINGPEIISPTTQECFYANAPCAVSYRWEVATVNPLTGSMGARSVIGTDYGVGIEVGYPFTPNEQHYLINLTVWDRFGNSRSTTEAFSIYGALVINPDLVPDPSPPTSNIPTGIKIYPNPVSGVLNIEFNQGVLAKPQAVIAKSAPTYDLRLYDTQGNLLRQQKTKGGTIQFNVSNLPNGIYYLHIYDGVNEKPEMRQIVVEH